MKSLNNPHLFFPMGIFLAMSIFSCQKVDNKKEYNNPFPDDFPPIVYSNIENKFNPDVIALGRKLFYDKNLSSNRTISCGSCHAQVHGFADHNIPLSFGIEGRKGTRNTPALINLAWMPHFMWDGGIRNLDVMPIAPFTHPNEMGMELKTVIERVEENNSYKPLLRAAYQSEKVNEAKILLPLSQFMLQLVSDQSKYDRVRRGNEKFNELEKQGYEIFKMNCANCHQEPLFTNQSFGINRISHSSQDLGRFQITQNPKDSFYFKIPTLRNVALTYPYMHDGSIKTLTDVLDAYNNINPVTNPEFPKFYLDNKQKQALLAFLQTLTDYKFISNLNHSEPR